MGTHPARGVIGLLPRPPTAFGGSERGFQAPFFKIAIGAGSAREAIASSSSETVAKLRFAFEQLNDVDLPHPPARGPSSAISPKRPTSEQKKSWRVITAWTLPLVAIGTIRTRWWRKISAIWVSE